MPLLPEQCGALIGNSVNNKICEFHPVLSASSSTISCSPREGAPNATKNGCYQSSVLPMLPATSMKLSPIRAVAIFKSKLRILHQLPKRTLLNPNRITPILWNISRLTGCTSTASPTLTTCRVNRSPQRTVFASKAQAAEPQYPPLNPLYARRKLCLHGIRPLQMLGFAAQWDDEAFVAAAEFQHIQVRFKFEQGFAKVLRRLQDN